MDLTPPQVVPGTNRPYNESGRTAERRRFAPRPRADRAATCLTTGDGSEALGPRASGARVRGRARSTPGIREDRCATCTWCHSPATCESVNVLAVAYARN